MSGRDFSRLDRLASTIKRVLAAPLNDFGRQHGIGMLTTTQVEVAPDLRRATVYLSIYGENVDQRELLHELARHAPDLQAILGRQLRSKRTPVLTFRIDDGMAQSDRITRLLGADAAKPTGD